MPAVLSFLAFVYVGLAADNCAIAPGERQPNGEPVGARYCRLKGATCVFNFDTKACISLQGDPCLKDDTIAGDFDDQSCLEVCCDAKDSALNCVFLGPVRQCISDTNIDTVLDECGIPEGYTLPNGRPCRQHCCRNVRGALPENPKGCIWNHIAETCTMKPDDVCVDDPSNTFEPCLAACCKSRSECNWDNETRQCLSPSS